MLDFSGIKEYCFFCRLFLDGHLTVVVLIVSLAYYCGAVGHEQFLKTDLKLQVFLDVFIKVSY